MDLVAYVPHHPLPGETLTADEFATSPGGKGANQAVACAKLSRARPTPGVEGGETARVSMVGCVGADGHGTQLQASLSSYGVDVSGVSARTDLKTGVALIIVDKPTGENRIVLSPGANHALQPADVANLDLLRTTTTPTPNPTPNPPTSSDEQHLPNLLIMQLEIPFATVLAALTAARTANVPVLLNPAPARPLPAEAYVGLAHLVVNETEAAILADVDERVLDDERGMETVAAGFVESGVRNVIITLGGRGVYFMSKDGDGGDGGRRRGLVPAEKAVVVDTTAAGDTFVGRYALDVVGGGGGGGGAGEGGRFDIEAAVRRANKAAAKTVERAGAQDSIPWRDELE
ncbi:Ribokinase-like protein [Chaetomium fimeti]|uniref:Ribokinase n=1 Tax=Chaetomium fimeti TaxID=1854472 RepID=A0AAE0H9K0_9PEZI|nr:Ribokinase-like protein [Chaetomium fimeti]